MDVIFELEALKPGVWTGDIDFCVPSQAFITSATTIRIDPAGTSPKVAEEEDEDDIPPFVLDIKTPHLVTLGGNFTMRVNVTNPTDSPLVLQTINLMGRLPEGIQIQSVSPEPEENQSDAESWYLHLEKSLAPGETFRTEWVMKPVKTGIWTGDLGFWSEKRESFATSSMTIRVNPSTPEETTVPD